MRFFLETENVSASNVQDFDTRRTSLFDEHRFGLLVVPTGGAPFGVNVPFLYSLDAGGLLTAELHVARANPIHQYIDDATEVLLACQGPDAYISPDWYGIENEVPTWTYTAVHLKGSARVLPAERNLDHVDRLSTHFENLLLPKKPWTSGKMDAAKRTRMMTAIVTIEISVHTVEAQKKLIQHKSDAHHIGAIAGLRSLGDAGSSAVADLMQQTLDGRED